MPVNIYDKSFEGRNSNFIADINGTSDFKSESTGSKKSTDFRKSIMYKLESEVGPIDEND